MSRRVCSAALFSGLLAIAAVPAQAQLLNLFAPQQAPPIAEPAQGKRPAAAQPAAQPQPQRQAAPARLSHSELTERHNQNTVSIISGTPAGTYLSVAYDMSAVLDDGDNLRILPIVGKGSVQNVRDILRLKGVDMGIVQSDVMSHFKQKGELGENIENRLVYITKLYNEEMHLVVHSSINDIKDLAGKKVNFAEVNSGTQFSARMIFDFLGVKVEEVNMGQADALVKLKTGEIAASVFIAGRPTAVLAKLTKDPALKLLAVPFTDALENNSYLPAKLSSQDYPALIPEGQSIDTIAVGAVLAVYNWPRDTDRYRRVARFVDAFFSRFQEFQGPARHPKWKEVNLAATLKGWKRLALAQEAVDKLVTVAAASAQPAAEDNGVRKQAAKAAPGDPAEQERLFQQFLEWRKLQRR